MAFAQFPDLPPELRAKIWSTALAVHLYSKDGVCIFSTRHEHDTGTAADGSTSQTPRVKANRLMTTVGPTPLLRTCAEARDIALSSPGGPNQRPFNPDLDILYIEGKLLYPFITSFCLRTPTPPWIAGLRRLGLGLPVADAHHLLGMALPQLHCLETISVVFPDWQRGSALNIHTDIPTPTAAVVAEVTGGGPEPKGPPPSFRLRTLTDVELQELVMQADYEFDVPGGAIPVRWTKSAAAYLDEIRDGLEEEIRGSEKTRAPCWDIDQDALKLKYDAEIFVLG